MKEITGKNLLIFRAYGISGNHFSVETAIAGQLGLLGLNVSWLVCDGVFEQCDHHWQLINPKDKADACKVCYKAALQRRDFYSLKLSGLSEYLSEENYSAVSAWSEGLGSSELEGAFFDGFPIGYWCRSSVNTQLRCSVFDFSNLLHVSVYRQYLRSTALALIAYKNYLIINNVDYVLLMNGRTFATRMVLEVSKAIGIPVAIHEFGRSEETRILRANENCHSLVGLNGAWEEWKDEPLDLVERGKVKEHFSSRVGGRGDFAFNAANTTSAEYFLRKRQEGRKVVSLFTSSTDEIASAEGWAWKFTQLEWIRQIVDYFKVRPDLYLVIRCHPNHVNRLMGVDGQFIDGLSQMSLPDNVLIIWPDDSCDTYSLINFSESVFVYASTVAIEAVLLGKNVFFGGGGLYRDKGIFYQTDCDLDGVPDAIESFLFLEETGCSREKAERFYYFYFFRQVYDVPFLVRNKDGLFCKPEAFTQVIDSKIISDLVGFYLNGSDFFPKKIASSSPAVAVFFSVVLTTYNRPAMLKDALVSLARQTFRDFEVILVNDCGEPVESLLLNYNFPITYLRQGTNKGLSAARNAALKLAKGRYIVYLDDDDIYLPGHLAVLAEAFESSPDSVIYTAVEYVTEKIENGRRIELSRSMPFRHEAYDRDRLFVQNYIPVNTWAHPRSMLSEVGEFDTGLSAFEDWDMLLRLAARYPFVHVAEVTAEVHQRPSSGSDHMLGREQKNFGALYEKIYNRHSDLNSETVRIGRRANLKQFGVSDLSNKQPASLKDWLGLRVLSPVQKRLVGERLEQTGNGPSFGVLLLDVDADRQKILTTLASLTERSNLYSNVEPVVFTSSNSLAESFGGRIVGVTEANWVLQLNEFLATADFDWLVLAKAGDEFTSAGFLMAGLELLGAGGNYLAIYCDELYREEDGALGAAFRPSMNLDYLLSFPAGMARHWLFHRKAMVEAGGFNPDFTEALELELILRLVNRGGLSGIGHVDEPLLISSAPALANIEDEQRAIIDHLHQRGYVNARIDSSLPGRYLINYGHTDTPLVSILIAVEDRLPMLLRCVTSIMESTRYSYYEILLLDRGGYSKELREWLAGIAAMAEQRIRVLHFSKGNSQEAIYNQAAVNARGDYLVLLSQSAAVISDAWLDEILNHALRPEVGIVGAELISKESTISHAGLILGLQGPVGRPFTGEELSVGGYMQRLQVEQNYSAVSSDCLAISKELWTSLEGLDTGVLSGTLAGADLCLRAREAGYLTVWSPRVKMMISQEPKAPSVEESDALYAKWLPLLARDPAYNANFSLVQPGGFKLADAALSWRPLASWRPLPVVLAHPADQFGCGHYRVMQPFNAQLEAGLIDGALSMGLMHVADLERYDPDVILLQRQIGSERLEAMRRMKTFSRAFKVYELDDYLPNLPIRSIHRKHMPKDIVKSLRRGLSYVDRFVVSTDVMAEAFAEFHRDIRVVKNRLDPRWWSELPTSARRSSKKPRVGWAGGASHTGDLEMIADVVKELAAEVEWVFFGMCPDKLKPYIHEFHEGVAIERYAKKLASLNLDLALAPVEQNLFNECKSNLRLLEYGACGFPVICSDVRCYQDGSLPVTRVKNRFRDWVDAIRTHINDLDATAKAGDNLRAAVLGGWMLEGENLEAWRKAWLQG